MRHISFGLLIVSILIMCGQHTAAQANQKFALDCENVAATQFNMGPKGFDSYRAATDTYSTKYVYRGDETLLSKYPSSSEDKLEITGFVVKKGFHNTENLEAFFEFVSFEGRYLKTYSFHKRTNDPLVWRAVVTNHGNNKGQLFERTYWYHCQQIVGE